MTATERDLADHFGPKLLVAGVLVDRIEKVMLPERPTDPAEVLFVGRYRPTDQAVPLTALFDNPDGDPRLRAGW